MATTKTNTTKDSEVPHVAATSSAGKAYQFVAQSSAIAIQDATDYLRNMSTIATTAAGVAAAQMIEHPEQVAELQKIIVAAQSMVQEAANNFEMISQKAAQAINNFPKEDN